jgi:cell division GTPase FtsZ
MCSKISRISSDSLDKRNNFVSVLFGDNKKHAPRVAINAQGRFLDALVSDVKFCVIVCEAADYKSAESAKLLTKRAKSSGTLTFCVVNTPFYFEGPERLKRARKTIASLQALADTVIDVPSDAFLEMIPKNSSMTDAYSMIDTVIGRTVTNILELASKRGLAEEKIDALLVLGNDLNYPSETLEMKNSWTSLTGLNKLLTNTMIKKMQSKQDYASEDKLINSEDTEYRNNQSSDSTKTNPDTKQQPNHSSNLLHKLRAFGVGDIGCNAVSFMCMHSR